MTPFPHVTRASSSTFSRRSLLGSGLTATALALVPGALTGCAGSEASEPLPTARPSFYPADYDQLVEAAKQEKGLTVYSNMGDENWAPIIKGFRAKYPFVSAVTTADLGGAEAFQKYYNEAATGASQVSMIVSGDPLSWKDALGKDILEHYSSPEATHQPDFAQPQEGMYTFSADPMLIAWNRATVTGAEPKSIGALLGLVEKDRGGWNHKVTTYDIASTFGLSIAWAWHRDKDPDWKLAERLLPAVRHEGGSGTMVEKLSTGEYNAAVFISSTVLLPAVKKSGDLLGWSYIEDGTPVFLRNMGIVKKAPSPATAKLMLDYLLSEDGQRAIHAGGFTPLRRGIDVDRSYDTIEKAVGRDNVVIIDSRVPTSEEQKAFRSRWASAMGAQ